MTQSQYREAVLKSGYIYQLYTYLRSQERVEDPLSFGSSGLFLYPTVDGDLDETVRIQGHEIRFATVDLSQPTATIVNRLRSLVAIHGRRRRWNRNRLAECSNPTLDWRAGIDPLRAFEKPRHGGEPG